MSNRQAALPLGKALSALGLPAATWHRRVSEKPKTKSIGPPTIPKPQPNALSPLKQQEALDLLRCDRFVDRAPAQIVQKLMDEGRYVCSESAFYRLLAKHGELKERRRVRRHTSATKPELLATGPNQVWSWDITRLKAA